MNAKHPGLYKVPIILLLISCLKLLGTGAKEDRELTQSGSCKHLGRGLTYWLTLKDTIFQDHKLSSLNYFQKPSGALFTIF